MYRKYKNRKQQTMTHIASVTSSGSDVRSRRLTWGFSRNPRRRVVGYECRKCSYSVRKLSLLLEHWQTANHGHVSNHQTFRCDQCRYTAHRRKAHLVNHVQLMHLVSGLDPTSKIFEPLPSPLLVDPTKTSPRLLHQLFPASSSSPEGVVSLPSIVEVEASQLDDVIVGDVRDAKAGSVLREESGSVPSEIRGRPSALSTDIMLRHNVDTGGVFGSGLETKHHVLLPVMCTDDTASRNLLESTFVGCVNHDRGSAIQSVNGESSKVIEDACDTRIASVIRNDGSCLPVPVQSRDVSDPSESVNGATRSTVSSGSVVDLSIAQPRDSGIDIVSGELNWIIADVPGTFSSTSVNLCSNSARRCVCLLCPLSYKRIADLNRHMRQKHGAHLRDAVDRRALQLAQYLTWMKTASTTEPLDLRTRRRPSSEAYYPPMTTSSTVRHQEPLDLSTSTRSKESEQSTISGCFNPCQTPLRGASFGPVPPQGRFQPSCFPQRCDFPGVLAWTQAAAAAAAAMSINNSVWSSRITSSGTWMGSKRELGNEDDTRMGGDKLYDDDVNDSDAEDDNKECNEATFRQPSGYTDDVTASLNGSDVLRASSQGCQGNGKQIDSPKRRDKAERIGQCPLCCFVCHSPGMMMEHLNTHMEELPLSESPNRMNRGKTEAQPRALAVSAKDSGTHPTDDRSMLTDWYRHSSCGAVIPVATDHNDGDGDEDGGGEDDDDDDDNEYSESVQRVERLRLRSVRCCYERLIPTQSGEDLAGATVDSKSVDVESTRYLHHENKSYDSAAGGLVTSSSTLTGHDMIREEPHHLTMNDLPSACGKLLTQVDEQLPTDGFGATSYQIDVFSSTQKSQFPNGNPITPGKVPGDWMTKNLSNNWSEELNCRRDENDNWIVRPVSASDDAKLQHHRVDQSVDEERFHQNLLNVLPGVKKSEQIEEVYQKDSVHDGGPYGIWRETFGSARGGKLHKVAPDFPPSGSWTVSSRRLKRFCCSACPYRSNFRSDVVRHIRHKHPATTESAHIKVMNPEIAAATLTDYLNTWAKKKFVLVPRNKSPLVNVAAASSSIIDAFDSQPSFARNSSSDLSSTTHPGVPTARPGPDEGKFYAASTLTSDADQLSTTSSREQSASVMTFEAQMISSTAITNADRLARASSNTPGSVELWTHLERTADPRHQYHSGDNINRYQCPLCHYVGRNRNDYLRHGCFQRHHRSTAAGLNDVEHWLMKECLLKPIDGRDVDRSTSTPIPIGGLLGGDQRSLVAPKPSRNGAGHESNLGDVGPVGVGVDHGGGGEGTSLKSNPTDHFVQEPTGMLTGVGHGASKNLSSMPFGQSVPYTFTGSNAQSSRPETGLSEQLHCPWMTSSSLSSAVGGGTAAGCVGVVGASRRRKAWRCQLCPYATYKRSQLACHASLHGSHQRYRCLHCCYSVSGLHLLMQHNKLHVEASLCGDHPAVTSSKATVAGTSAVFGTRAADGGVGASV